MIISNKLYNFIANYAEKQLNRSLNHKQLNQDTTFEEIGIDDLEFDLFMQQFIETFDIDDSKFNGRLYFGLGLPIIDNNVSLIRKVIGKRKWLPLAKEERKPFTLGNLESALNTGILT